MAGPDVEISLDELELGLPLSENHGQHSMPGVPRSEYHHKLKPKLEHRPWLKILDEFLDPTTESFAVSTDHRLKHFDVQVIHISASGVVNGPITCGDATTFKDAISTNGEERSGTLIIAEDLSRAMIDALGIECDLEPEFFACHLQGTESFRMGHWESPLVRAPVRAPNVLPGCLRKAPYYTAEFRRPYHIHGGLEKIIDLRSKITNTPRGAQVLRDHIPDTFVFEKLSVYKRKGSKFGVILTDKLLSNEPPASYMLDIITLFDYDSDTIADTGQRGQVSCREELVRWYRQLKPQDAKVLFDDHEPLALRPVLKIVERSSATFLAHARYTMSRIVILHCDEQFPDSISFFLKVSRSLHWEIYDQLRTLRWALLIASLGCGEKIAEQIQDFKSLMEDMEAVLKSLEEDVRFLAAAATIREGKNVGLVSKFAFLFLPVSLLATILSISDQGYARFVVLGGLGLPFVLISMYLMFFWKPSRIDSLRHALLN